VEYTPCQEIRICVFYQECAKIKIDKVSKHGGIMGHYSIGEFSEKVGLSIDTLRYYEKEDIIHCHREENNRRYYDDSDFAWVEFIIRLKNTGMSLKNIHTYAALRYKGDSTIPQRLELLFNQLDKLHDKQDEVTDHISFLENKIKIYQEINPS